MKSIKIGCKGTGSATIESLQRFQGKLKYLPDENFNKLKNSILKNGFKIPLMVWHDKLMDGHQRLFVLEQLRIEGYEIPEIPVIELNAENEKEAKKLIMMINSRYGIISEEGFYEFAQDFDLDDLKDEIEIPEINLDPAHEEDAVSKTEVKKKLQERFIVPPFSIFDTRQGYWQERRRLWLMIGIKSEEGRGTNLLKFSESAQLHKKDYSEGKKPKGTFNNKTMPKFMKKVGDQKGKSFEDHNQGLPENVRRKFGAYESNGKIINRGSGKAFGTEGNISNITGTSIFDPVLCEILYRWFNVAGGKILDPFSGGSVRGIVAGMLGYRYKGIDLSIDQIKANQNQAKKIIPTSKKSIYQRPEWIADNSMNVNKICKGEKFDMIFSCPPYHDLEIYSDNPSDLSNLPWKEFSEQYKDIISKSCALIQPDRFGCFVVSDIRDKEGFYKKFVALTIDAFEGAGFRFYNDIILINSFGTLPIRVGKQFQNRKVGKTHQNVLVFYKGDPNQIRKNYPEIDFGNVNDLIKIFNKDTEKSDSENLDYDEKEDILDEDSGTEIGNIDDPE